jgi:hypothetical protein
MKNILYILISICFSFILARQVAAITATPSATPTQNIEDKYKTIVQENLSSAEAKLKEKVNLQSLVGYVGKITTISSGNLTFESHGNIIQATTATQTAILKNGTTIKISSLAIGDKIIVIGTSVKEGIVQAKRVTVIKDEPVLVNTTAVVTKIVSIDLKKKTLTLSLSGMDRVLTLSKKSTVKLEGFSAAETILGIVKEYSGGLSISRAKAL